MMTPPSQHQSFAAQRFAVAAAAFVVFVNLYSPQAILPLLTREFGVSAAEIAMVMTASTIAVAVTAPLTGAVSDVLGRKRLIVIAMALLTVPTVMIAQAQTLAEIIVWRFVQGLALPPIFAVTIAYVGEEWPLSQSAMATSVYIVGASTGATTGRVFTGVMADTFGWRAAFVVLGILTLAGSVIIATALPRETKFVRSKHILDSLRQMVAHLRNPRLVATFAVGFGNLFVMIAALTFINFHLAAPPYSLPPSTLGAIFIIYLGGNFLTSIVGRSIDRLGRRITMIVFIAIWILGTLLTLAPPLPVIIVGLVLIGVSGLITQAISTSHVTTMVTAGRSSAVGLYVTSFYVGGGVGAAAAGIAWRIGEWPACAALIVAMQAIMVVIVFFAWREDPAQAGRAGV